MTRTEPNYVELEVCLACGGSTLTAYLDLGSQPLANAFTKDGIDDESFPLCLNVCETCWHSQLSIAVNPEILFRDYLYVSGTSPASNQYFSSFAEDVTARFGRGRRILEIASNDGSLLSQLNTYGHSTLGVDPAANLAPTSAARGVNTVFSFWPSNLVEHLRPGYDVIIAMNVCAHVSDPLGFLTAAASLLDDDSVLLVQTSQARMVENFEFDTAYHEHLSFFNCSSLQRLAQRAGLEIREASYRPVHGTSYLWELGLIRNQPPERFSFAAMLAHETNVGLFDRNTYNAYSERASALAKRTNEVLQQHRSDGYKVLGYGAAAKGNTFINFGRIELEAIVDANPLKQGLYAPGSGTPIIAPPALAQITEPCAFLIPAWNYRDEICEDIRQLRGNVEDVGIVYYPEFETFPIGG